jgi:hypothetical protein
MFNAYGQLSTFQADSYGDVRGDWGLSRDPIKAQRKCEAAQAKLAAIRAKRTGKGDNKRVRSLERDVRKLCTWAQELARKPSFAPVEDATFDANFAVTDQALDAAMMDETMGFDAGTTNVPTLTESETATIFGLPWYVVAGGAVLAIGGIAFFMARR